MKMSAWAKSAGYSDASIKAAEFAERRFKTMQDVIDYVKDDPSVLVKVYTRPKEDNPAYTFSIIYWTVSELIDNFPSAKNVKIKDSSAMSHGDGKHWTAIVSI